MGNGLPLEAWSNERLTDIFTGYANELTSSGAPLYAALCTHILADDDVKALLTQARAGQPMPNLLFAAVHLLLLRGAEHPLRAYYPDLTETPLPRDEAYPAFRDFVLAHRDEVVALVQSRLVQTNVLERCGALLPGIATAAAELESPAGPLAMLEIGASAGLNLLWDRYAYEYVAVEGGTMRWGDASSPVKLPVEVRGERLPEIPSGLHAAWRCGVDLAPVDLTATDDFWWQRALMWPERIDRQYRLDAARDMMAADPVRLVAGDANEHLPALIAEAPPALPLVLLASFTLYQFPEDARTRLFAAIAEASRDRPIALVSVDITRIGDLWGTMHLSLFRDGARTTRTLGTTHPHGAWVAWRA